MTREFAFRLIIIFSAILSASSLSMLFAMRTTFYDAVVACFGAGVALFLTDRGRRLNAFAMIFMLAGAYGLTRTAFDWLRQVFHQSDMYSTSQLIHRVPLYCAYLVIGLASWSIWRWRS